jgi:AraC-like DNA-binding protein
MKPALERLPLDAEESFVAKYFDYAYYPTPWHFHPEYELVLVTESTGKRFIGDKISEFEPGDLALIGPHLPHLYRNDPVYYEPGSPKRAKSIVIHFSEQSFGQHFLALPEARSLTALFSRSARGLDILGETNKVVSEKLYRLLDLNGLPRWMLLLEILHLLAESDEYQFISDTTLTGRNELESERLSMVFEYVMENFREEINIAVVANLVNMAENSFSRYFSLRTRKTFSNFLTDVRISHASKLLIENKMSVANICFNCGFNNLSNFNRQFKKMYKVSPLQYRQQFTSTQR